MWKEILVAHVDARTLTAFDSLCAAFCSAEKVLAFLLEPHHIVTRNEVEEALGGLMTRY